MSIDLSEPIAIFSNSEISEGELIDFLDSIGAVTKESNSFLGRFSEENKHVWISISNEELKYVELCQKKAIEKILKSAPKTCIILELSSTPGTEYLVAEFLTNFSAQWLCAVCVSAEDDTAYSIEQLKKILESDSYFD